MNELNILIYAAMFVSIYALHRILFSSSYFGFSEVIYGYKETITLKAFFIKLLIPLLYTIAICYFTKSETLAYSAVFWGSILIITPPFLNKEHIDFRFYNKENILYAIYVIFVLSNCFICYYTIKLYKLSSLFLHGYVNQFSSSQLLFNHLMDVLILPAALIILTTILNPIFNTLNKEIKINDNSECSDEV